MSSCPACQIELTSLKGIQGVALACPQCRGCSITLAVLRKTVRTDLVNQLWQAAREGDYARVQPCPACQCKMVRVPLPIGSNRAHLDVCTACQSVWFDASEFESLSSDGPAPEGGEKRLDLPQHVREKLALGLCDLKAEIPDGLEERFFTGVLELTLMAAFDALSS